MRKRSMIAIIFFAALAFTGMSIGLKGGHTQDKVLEYEVISVEPSNWIVTARENESGEVMKFRLPPSVFKGKTFDANLVKVQPGQRFSVKGSRNARLNELIIEKPLPGPKPGRGSLSRLSGENEELLAWEILHVDAKTWIVTSKNRQTHKIAKFRVHPEAFNGFRFKANIRGIEKGKGFSILTPNYMPMNNVATLLEIKK